MIHSGISPAHVSGNTCSDTPECYTSDTKTSCIIGSDVQLTNELIGVCSYPSEQPNSDPNDCIVIDPCANVVCNDGKICTDDICDPATGDCVFTNDDTNTCGSASDTICDNPDTCVAGVCQNNYEPSTTECRESAGIRDEP